MELALLLALACAGRISAQELRIERTADDPAKLTLDVLIGRLPRVDQQGIPGENVDYDAEFQTRIERGDAFTAEQWKRALVSTGALRIRERWPAGVPFAVSMRVPDWLWSSHICLEPQANGLRVARLDSNMGGGCGTCLEWEMRRAAYQELGLIPAGKYSGAFTATFERDKFRSQRVWEEDRPDPPHPPGGVFWKGTLTFPIEIVDTLDAAIPPVSSAEIDAAVRTCLSLTDDGWLVADPDLRDPLLAELGLSLAIDVLEDGVQRKSLTLVPSDYDSLAGGACVHDTPERPIAFVPIATEGGDAAGGALATAEARKHWSLRVRGTSDHVLQLWYATKRWSGELTISFDELITREHELAPQGREFWWTPDER